MPNFISNMGVWTPANERAVNVNTGQIYEGKDRAALDILKQEGTSTIGMDSRKDPENIMRARQLGMSVDEWLKLNEPPTPEAIKNQKEKETLIVTHKDQPKKKPVNAVTGGVEFSGGFGDTPKP